MSGKCGSCGAPLFGKQRRFCSDACRNKYWNSARRRGEFPAAYSPNKYVQEFLDDLFRLIAIHKEVIDAAIKNDVEPKEPD